MPSKYKFDHLLVCLQMMKDWTFGIKISHEYLHVHTEGIATRMASPLVLGLCLSLVFLGK